jgi:hypothetical protein
MGEMLIIDPTWRGGKKFAIYRNPDSRDRRDLFSDDYKSARFVLAGDGSLFVGQSYEFTHADSHTALTSLFEANTFWSGELLTAGPRFPVSFGGVLNPTIQQDDPRNTWGAYHPRKGDHVTAEWNARGDVCLARMGRYTLRDRGIVDHSIAWRKFTSGMRIGFPAIEPLPGFRVNEPVQANARCLLMLHGDGHLYTFDHEIPPLDAERLLSEAERSLNGQRTEPVVGLQLGGNGNAHIAFSEVTNPIAFMMTNQNAIEAFGGVIDFELSFNDRAVAKMQQKSYAEPRENFPSWSL